MTTLWICILSFASISAKPIWWPGVKIPGIGNIPFVPTPQIPLESEIDVGIRELFQLMPFVPAHSVQLVNHIHSSQLSQVRPQHTNPWTAGKTPPHLRPCHVEDNDFITCLKTQTKILIDLFQDGNTTYRIPPFNPFHIYYLPLARSQNFTLELSALYFHNITQVFIQRYVLDIPRNRMIIGFYFPTMKIDAIYQIYGTVFDIEIRTRGPINLMLESLSMDVEVPYYRIDNRYKAVEYASDVKFHLEQLSFKWDTNYAEDEYALNMLEQYVDQHWATLCEWYSPRLLVTIRNLLLPIFDRIVDHVELPKLLLVKKRPVRNDHERKWSWKHPEKRIKLK